MAVRFFLSPAELFELEEMVVLTQAQYGLGPGQLQLRWRVRNVAGEDFTEETDPETGEKLSITQLKVQNMSHQRSLWKNQSRECMKTRERVWCDKGQRQGFSCACNAKFGRLFQKKSLVLGSFEVHLSRHPQFDRM